jgi:phosphonate transport system permease protein
MTAASIGGTTQRPPKPGRSMLVPVGLAVAAVITYWALSAEFGIGLDLGAILEDIPRGSIILSEVLRPNFDFFPRTVGAMFETIQMAIIATAIGCGIALPAAFLASRVTAPNMPVLRINRAVLNVIRALPDLLYAMIFVTAVSIGPLAGILALILFNIGVIAKLLSETVDGIDVGPIEAARAAGANRMATVRTAVFPQVLPNYVAFSLYVFELNIRASTVIGIVGAGGIGNVLNAQIGFFRYDNVGLVILELFVLVLAIELVSVSLRRRLV